MYQKIIKLFKSSENSSKGLRAQMVKGSRVVGTKTIEITDSTILLKKPKRQKLILSDGDLMQLHIQNNGQSVYPVKFLRNEQNALAFELL